MCGKVCPSEARAEGAGEGLGQAGQAQASPHCGPGTRCASFMLLSGAAGGEGAGGASGGCASTGWRGAADPSARGE